MKTLLFLFACFLSMNLSAQKEFVTPYKIKYEVTYSIDSTNLKNKTTEILYLYTGANYGVFMNYNEAHEEERIADYEKQMRAQKGQSTIAYHDHVSRETNFNSMFFKDLKSDSIWTVSTLVYNHFLYSEPVVPQWKLEDETKIMYDYRVQKSTTYFAGRKYTAWFAPEIPIPDGPYLFKGLPGLIVDLVDEEEHYHFRLLSIQPLEKPKIWHFPEEVKSTSKEEFRKLKDKQIDLKTEDIFSAKGDETEVKVVIGNREVTKGEYRRMLKDKYQKKNNPIELP